MTLILKKKIYWTEYVNDVTYMDYTTTGQSYLDQIVIIELEKEKIELTSI